MDNLESAVLELLTQHNIRLAAAESCTGGLVTARLTAVPGASPRVMGGVVAYHPDVKVKLLRVSADSIRRHGVVSEQIALEMARGVCQCTGAELGVGVTGLAGPDGDGSGTPVGTVCLALHDARNSCEQAATHHFDGGRQRVRELAADAVLEMVRVYLK